jgi:hypothetical protein
MEWVRLWLEMPNDPKWRTVARRAKAEVPQVISVYVCMMTNAAASDDRGTLDGWDDEDVAMLLDMEPETVSAIRVAMQGKVLDGEYLTGWEKRQPKREDSSADRTSRYREKQRATRGDAPVTQCDASVTRSDAPETETDSDKETDKETDRLTTAERVEEAQVASVGRSSSGLRLPEAVIEALAAYPEHWGPALVLNLAAAKNPPRNVERYCFGMLKNWASGDGTPPVPPMPSVPRETPAEPAPWEGQKLESMAARKRKAREEVGGEH